jgi:DNA polymerase-3 subunit gamma/tau
VYVIDEVHMLSTSAFNAMLKTLEEPPEHLKFILATTDPQKIPVTVLSRCLQFNLKQMPAASISAHLARLLEAEGIAFEAGALPLLARAAAGSMRDALSLLDQAIAHGGGSVATEGVRDMLGAVDSSYLLRLLEALAARDGAAMLEVADEMQARSLSFDTALQDLAAVLLRLALAQVAPEALDADLPDRDRLVALARSHDPESVQLYYQITLQGREDLALAPDEYAGFAMTLLRMLAFRPESPDAALSGPPAGIGNRAATGSRAAAAMPPRTAASVAQAFAPAVRSGNGPGLASAAAFDGDWPGLVGRLQVAGAAKELARNAALARHAEGVIELVVPKSMGHLADRSYQEKLKAALEQHFGGPLVLKVAAGEVPGATAAALEAVERETKRAEAARAVQGDKFVQDLVDIFDAKVIGSSIRTDGDKS